MSGVHLVVLLCFRSLFCLSPSVVLLVGLLYFSGKRQKAVYRLVTAPQGGTPKYTLAFAYDSPR